LTTKPIQPSTTAPADIFTTTHWTVVLAAGRRSTPQSDHALEELCRTYWYPLYAFVRRRGHSKEDAEDLTQAFFARFLEKNYLEGLSVERGRFRAFLLASLQHFLANEWDRSQRQKRGGQIPHLSLDWRTADTQFQIAAPAPPSPEKAFDREWAVALLDKVIERLRADCEAEGRSRQFSELKIFLATDTDTLSPADAARALGLNAGAARVAIHRLRKRYRQLLRDEVAQTLANPTQIDAEMQALLGAFS
jgi:RNA polymerase sigma-70 factor (ECF subfamily)